MKRGKEDEKVMSPMFPRLHVNEREKGGPRAPPRNKMALYEQLSIPSQRFKSGLNANHNTSSAASSSQVPMFSPLHLPGSAPQADNSIATLSDIRPSFAASRKRVDEEDFVVPVFVQPENGQNSKPSDTEDQDIISLSRPAQINRSSRDQSTNKVLRPNSTTVSNLRKKYRFHTQKPESPSEDQEDSEHPGNDVDELQSSIDALNHEVIDGPPLQNVQNMSSNGEYYKEKTKYSLGIQNGNRCEDDSDTSMVDSILGVYITPDEVVGVIGQNHFWKARREIVNQQRVFAIQVFELHRLIKVQKSFAGSPNLLHEDTTTVGKSLKISIPRQPSLEIIVKPPAEKTDNLVERKEGSPDSIVAKSSISSSQNVIHHHPSNQLPFPSNPQLTPVSSEPSTSPWYLNQPGGHHWLVPVMSPTEGLIYKPYAGPDHTGSNPMMSNLSNPPYGMPNFHPLGLPNSHPFFQGMVIPPNFPLVTHHGYFPPYGMPFMAPAISGSVADQENHFDEQQQNSCDGPTQMNNSIPNIQNFTQTRIGKESDLQASTVSSPPEGRNGLMLFPASQDDDVANENLARVIKVVPHNAVSANESAFRILQSIQKEREQYDSV